MDGGRCQSQKAVDEAQAIYDKHGKREWVEWAGKTLMPRLHVQILMERADAMRAEQDVMEEERYQAAPARGKVYATMDEPVSSLQCQQVSALTHLLTVRPVLHTEDEAEVYHHRT
jgi:hypothetical protein